MTRYASPALHQPDLHLSPVLIRSALGAAAIVFTAGLWFAVGAQAGRFGEADQTPRFELEPVVVSGHRLLPENAAIAMGATGAGAAVDCGNTQVGGGANRVTLSQ
jgi:hypothetical protein